MGETDGTGVVDSLGALREKCVVVLAAYGSSQALAAALGGVYFAFKSVKFVVPLHAELMAEAGGQDAAGYFAEAMVRSLHSSGDLLARAIVECGYANGPHISQLTYCGAGTERLKQKVDALLGLPAWKYVAAFTNTTKHNAFIDRTSVSAATGHEILFKEFERGDAPQPERTFGEVLGDAQQLMDAVSNILDWLRAAAPPSPLALAIEAAQQASPVSITATYTPPGSSDYVRSKRYEVEEPRD